MVLYDNELYALTKNQTSPTTRKGHTTMTQPQGSYLNPLGAVRLAIGAGVSFAASSADWMPDHMANTLKAAFAHPGFAFVHISQRCPHFDPTNFDHKTSSWFSFLKHEKGIPPDKRIADKTEVIEHDPSNLVEAFKLAADPRPYYGLFYQDATKPRYDAIMHNLIKEAKPRSRAEILDNFKI